MEGATCHVTKRVSVTLFVTKTVSVTLRCSVLLGTLVATDGLPRPVMARLVVLVGMEFRGRGSGSEFFALGLGPLLQV